MKLTSVFSAALLASTLIGGSAVAKSVKGADTWAKERFLIRGHLLNVTPQEDSSTSIGGYAQVDEAYVPGISLDYFFNDNVSAQLIAAVTPHDVKAKGTTAGDVNLGDVWLLPPTLTALYHFSPESTFRPYAGAGLGYIVYFDEDAGAMNDIEYDDGIAYVLQAGFDYGIDENWALNLDVKKIFHNTDVSINSGAVTADVDLDPWVVGVGVAYRF